MRDQDQTLSMITRWFYGYLKLIAYRKKIVSGAIFTVGLMCSVASYALTPEERLQVSLKDFSPIDGSSVWVWNQHLDQINKRKDLPRFFSFFRPTINGPIGWNEVEVFKKLFAPYLDPKYSSSHQIPEWYKDDPSEIGFSVWIAESSGGDVAAAIALGKLFRATRTEVYLKGHCFSSCVFLYAGAVKRLIFDDFGPARIGIHQPYTASIEEKSFEDMQKSKDLIGSEIINFLRSVNVSTKLYDAMEYVPSEDLKILNSSELNDFGLVRLDPVFAELQKNAEARAAGMTKQEYLQSKKAFDRCFQGFVSRFSVGKPDDPLLATLSDINGYLEGREKCMKAAFGKAE